MEIPKHIKYLSIIFFLNAAVALLIGGLTLASLIHSTLSTEALSGFPAVLSAIARYFGLGILTTTLAIIILIILGISLRKLKPWARTVTLAYGMLTILLGILSLITGDRSLSYYLFVQIYAVWVLTRPEVKEAFNNTSKGQQIPPSIQDDI
jgi:hypothetical protein